MLAIYAIFAILVTPNVLPPEVGTQGPGAPQLSLWRSLDHIMPELEALHWMPIPFQAKFRVLQISQLSKTKMSEGLFASI